MNASDIFQFIKADQFFPKYAPTVVNYKRKISGRNGRGNAIEFSQEDLKAIKTGLRQMMKDMSTPNR